MMEDYGRRWVRYQKEIVRVPNRVRVGYIQQPFREKFYRQEVNYEEGVGIVIGREGLHHKIFTMHSPTNGRWSGDHLVLALEEEIIEVGRQISLEELITSEHATLRAYALEQIASAPT